MWEGGLARASQSCSSTVVCLQQANQKNNLVRCKDRCKMLTLRRTNTCYRGQQHVVQQQWISQCLFVSQILLVHGGTFVTRTSKQSVRQTTLVETPLTKLVSGSEAIKLNQAKWGNVIGKFRGSNIFELLLPLASGRPCCWRRAHLDLRRVKGQQDQAGLADVRQGCWTCTCPFVEVRSGEIAVDMVCECPGSSVCTTGKERDKQRS